MLFSTSIVEMKYLDSGEMTSLFRRNMRRINWLIKPSEHNPYEKSLANTEEFVGTPYVSFRGECNPHIHNVVVLLPRACKQFTSHIRDFRVERET